VTSAQLLAVRVVREGGDEHDVGPLRAQQGSEPRTTRALADLRHVDDRHGSVGRQPGDRAVDVPVEQDVSDDGDPRPGDLSAGR
jgi:hypothetical protein